MLETKRPGWEGAAQLSLWTRCVTVAVSARLTGRSRRPQSVTASSSTGPEIACHCLGRPKVLTVERVSSADHASRHRGIPTDRPTRPTDSRKGRVRLSNRGIVDRIRRSDRLTVANISQQLPVGGDACERGSPSDSAVHRPGTETR